MKTFKWGIFYMDNKLYFYPLPNIGITIRRKKKAEGEISGYEYKYDNF